MTEKKECIYLCPCCGAFMAPAADRCFLCHAEAEDGPIDHIDEDDTGTEHSRPEYMTRPGVLYICGTCGAFFGPNTRYCGICGTELDADMHLEHDGQVAGG